MRPILGAIVLMALTPLPAWGCPNGQIACPKVPGGCRKLRDLAPLGREGDAPPLLGIAGLVVRQARAAKGGHTQLTLQKGTDVLDAICFGRTDLVEQLQTGVVVDVVARLASRTYQGMESLQLEIRDVALAGHLAGLRRARTPAGAAA